jgi:FkbM family methyltransferase
VNRPDYESLDYAALQPYLSQRRTAVDVGAHVGYWSRRLAADFEFVVAYEAEPVHAACHARNIANPNVMLHEIALSDHAGTVNFVTTILNSGMSHVSNQGVSVACEPLDRWKHRDVDLIKIDVEGHEYEVIQGAIRLLDEKKITYLQIEQHFDDLYENYFANIEEVLNSKGYFEIQRIRHSFGKFYDIIYELQQ